MGKLTKQQQDKLTNFLLEQGLSFKPLLDEMIDHVTCDLEDRMAQGSSFDVAWQQSISALPNNHFQNIQQETMATINKRFTISQGFSYLALVLLFVSMIFKVMHWPLADELLLLAFASIAISLLTGSLSGIFLNKEKKGAIRVLAVVSGVILLIVAYAFKLLHMPGADQLVLLGVTLTIASLLMNTLYVYQHASGEGNLLTYLHEKYTPGIERFLLFLLFPLMIYRVVSMLLSPELYIGNLLLLIVIFGSGLQFIALNWRIMEKDLTKRNKNIFAGIIISILCFTLPLLGEAFLPLNVRVTMIVLFSAVSAWLAWQLEEEKKPLLLIMAWLVPIVFAGWGLIMTGIIPLAAAKYIFNLPLMLMMAIGLLLCRKHGAMRAYMIVSLASYILERLSP